MIESALASLNKKYLGRWCIISYEKEDRTKNTAGGVITYFGPNLVLGWPFQITIARTPIRIKKLLSIKEYREEKI